MKIEQLQALERELAVNVADLTGPAASAALAQAWTGEHEKLLADARRRGGVQPAYLVAVDRQRGKPVTQAREMIVSVYDYRREAVQHAMDVLLRNSPQRSGNYKRGHQVFVNNSPVGQACPPLAEGDQVFIANTVPYARRLEVGLKNDGSAFVVQVSPRIYERSLKEVRRRFANAVRITMTYVDLQGAYVTKGSLRQIRARGHRRGKQKPGTVVRFPALRFEDF